MRTKPIAQIIAIVTLCVASAVSAAPSCSLPASIPATHAEKAGDVRNVPIGGYLLTFSWSPEYCFAAKRNPRAADDPTQSTELQCGASNHFRFTLHGLWPEGKDATWPQYCHPVGLVSAPTVKANLCRTPSVGLIEHEWEKHGSCNWATPEAYFGQSAKLMDHVKLPDLSGLTRGQINASAIRAAFMAANRTLPHDAIGVAANKGGWFEEVRLCLDTGFNYRKCPDYSFGAADADRVKVARVR